MGKYGKRNIVSRNITDYNLALLGEPGIGKTTLMYEVCEKLVDDGYIILNMGKEDGISALNAIAESIDSWKKFDEVTKDIIRNKETDYSDLKIVVIDTIDQLFDLAEPEVIRRYNSEKMGEKGFKPVKTINAAYGGFGAGLAETEKLVLDKIWDLKNVGIAVWMCGHTKTKDIIDPVTDQSYTTLSALLSQRYFNAIKTKMHVVGMAVIDRDVITESTGRKNIVTKEEITKNKVVSESRKIIFRDDNYGIDSKSRFANIVNEIPLNSDAFIKAIQDAIDDAANGHKVIKQAVAPVKEKPDEQVLDAEKQEGDTDDDIMNTPDELDATDDELRAEIRKLNRSADEETKAQVKGILKSAGVKLNDADHDTLVEIFSILNN